jgi:hypothetical protein
MSDDSDSGTPLPPVLAAAVQLVSDSMMETGGNFELAQSIFGECLSGKAKAKENMARALQASPRPPPPPCRCVGQFRCPTHWPPLLLCAWVPLHQPLLLLLPAPSKLAANSSRLCPKG